MTDDATRELAELVNKAGEIHHMVFADTDGSDDDWATFYSDWLLTHGKISDFLRKRPIRSHLTRDLVELDEQYTAASPSDPWPTWYAERLIAMYS
jgi:hypothetical protein